MSETKDISSNKKLDHKKKIGFCPRVWIEKVSPEIDGGQFSIKRTFGQKVLVSANVFADGHDNVIAYLLYRTKSQKSWIKKQMNFLGNDRWEGSFLIESEEAYIYSVQGNIDEFFTWQNDFQKKYAAGQDLSVDLKIGIKMLEKTISRVKDKKDSIKLQKYLDEINECDDPATILKLVMGNKILELSRKYHDDRFSLTYKKELEVTVEDKLAGFSSWYEIFPRSWSDKPGKHGTFKDCERLLPEISRMGFDIVYLPPIHPIGRTKRKGKNNAVDCEKNDPGSPWAIGSKEGGHKSIISELGTLEEFKSFVKKAKENDIKIALDLAYQCSPDHPYVKEHPQWFKWRPDGSVQFAENPPKKYEDVLPINFETEDWQDLWEELKSIVLFWIEQGVSVFRVDNPHTKPFLFWDWLIAEIKEIHPKAIFLAEAFTRPKLMQRLAKGGFSQSYTYFTWRSNKYEFTEYLMELTKTEIAEYMRPNFWPNTPDILPPHLQSGERSAFIMRAVLASTLSSNWGIYGPAFELCISAAVPEKEEYIDSEKYEIKNWDWDKKGNIKETITKLNKIRKENPALQVTNNINFCQINNENILVYYKATEDLSNIILVVVNLDSWHTMSGTIEIPLDRFGIQLPATYIVEDLLTGDKYSWLGRTSYVELDPKRSPAHIFKIK